MITGEKEQLDDLAANNMCAADSGVLSVAWHAEKNCYYLRCGVCGETKGIKRVLSLTEEHKAGTELPPAVKDRVERGMSRQRQKESKLIRPITMGGIPATDLGTGELLNLDIMKALVDYARKYGLDPAREHVCLMYGKPYITIDGYLYHARETKEPYQLASRPLNSNERHDYQVGDADYAWIGRLVKPATGAEFFGLGIVTAEERTEKSKRHPDQLAAPVVARHPWQLAQKRAEWQTLRRAFPIGESPQGNVE